MRKIFLVGLLFSLIGLLFIGCQSKKETAQKVPPVPVLTTKPVIKDIPLYIESIGTLHPSLFLEVLPQASGMITEVAVKEGDWVQEGTALFTINPHPYTIKVQEAEASLAMSLASLQAAQKKNDRFKALAQKDLIAQTEWDELESQIQQAQASLEAAKAKVLTAKFDEQQCHTLSPIEGRIGKITIHPGVFVNARQQSPLFTISKMNSLIIEFSITEKELATLPKDSSSLQVQPLCHSFSPIAGTLTFLDNHFDQKSGLLLVKGKIDNPDYALRPGQAVRVRIPIAMITQAKVIPQKAVKYNQQGPYIYIVLPDSTVGQRSIVLGHDLGTEVVVKEGLEEAEPLITDGHLRLSPGVKVEAKT